ncbi:MAG: hypothetical protein CL881_01680 [Dehalococcoidia bacterium]|nr:hypothetical protein [Dehalococcoidia bacterium]|tara:strand:+ start:6688 stop:7572 length:885 start_codon:yes stop_codon:yes gene_type:complete
MAPRPTNTIIRGPRVLSDDEAAAAAGLRALDPSLTDEDIRGIMAGEGMPNTRMGVTLGYEIQPGRTHLPGSSLTGGQPVPLREPEIETTKTWRGGDVLNYVQRIFDSGTGEYEKLAQGLLIEGYIDDVENVEDLYELDTVLEGIGTAINEVTRRAQQFGMTTADFVKESGMENVPTLEGMFADTDFDLYESELNRIRGVATKIPDPDYLTQLFDSTSRSQAGFNLRKSNPGGFQDWLRGYRAAKEEKAARGEEMNAEAYAIKGVESMAPEPVALNKRSQYVAVATQALDSYGSA